MLEVKDIKSRTIFSALSLFFQSGYSAFIRLVANAVITILLSRQIYGIYFTALSTISLLNYFSDIGLAASLIQKKEISEDDLKTTFTVQQFLVVTIVVIGFLSTSLVANFYDLPKTGIYLYWSLLISFFISSLKTIPSILLERKIQFQKIVIVQVLENTVFNFTVIILAILGFQLRSFIYAVIIRSFVGLVAIYVFSFWRPRIGISLPSFGRLVRFGLPFQTNSLLALFKDDLITLYLAKVLGFSGIGSIGWGKKWGEALIRIIMDNISRVIFPVISRLQENHKLISKLIEKILFYQTLALAPALLGLVLIADKIMRFIPGYYEKWSASLPLLYLFSLSAFLSSYSSPFTNMFNALGKVKISLYFMVFWTVVTWLLTPIFTKSYGIYGL